MIGGGRSGQASPGRLASEKPLALLQAQLTELLLTLFDLGDRRQGLFDLEGSQSVERGHIEAIPLQAGRLLPGGPLQQPLQDFFPSGRKLARQRSGRLARLEPAEPLEQLAMGGSPEMRRGEFP